METVCWGNDHSRNYSFYHLMMASFISPGVKGCCLVIHDDLC